ncbi:hypothetical protein M409DRAFT_29868 [Zasmidium cellare ATCC 36951]|uniref:Secreted protein n=1 Tax=Zasmidium cellare ATCC 36951 TaxID=1080233 RepID=A0A6A6C0C3_ZASCE|nr:uncharacterized protein M409DRAFT_29868 [Zasmidium cellare ATCC 36951]KAF2159708.1 hypothetical protein M409DRAFT_29868 [Zasmidium cellare ATCC 36951]
MSPSAHFILALVAAFLVPVMASLHWEIAFYTGENCDADTSYNYTRYWGERTYWCRIAGNAGDNCEWHTNNGATDVEGCTSPIQPQPKSFRYGKRTLCNVGDYLPVTGSTADDALACSDHNQLFGKGTEETCIKLGDWHLEGEFVSFVCIDPCNMWVGEKPPECRETSCVFE